jgi:predicted signal transduction protein with EAL and GGDEF domain
VRRNFAALAAERFEADHIVPTVSIGVALGHDQQMTIAALMASADRALYRAKANGRNRVESAMPVPTEREAWATLVPGDIERRVWRKASAHG